MEYRLGEYECTRCRLALQPRDPAREEEARRARPPEKRTVERYPSTLGAQSTQEYTERLMEHQYAIQRTYNDPLELEKKLLFWISTGLTGAYFLYLLFDRLWGSFNLGRDLLALSPTAIVMAVCIGLMYIMLFGGAIWLKWLVFILGAAGLALAVLGGLFMGARLPQLFWSGASYFDDERYTRMSIVLWTTLLVSCGVQFWYLSVIWRDIQSWRQWNSGERS